MPMKLAEVKEFPKKYEDAVPLLEGLLAEAKSGELQGVAIVALYHGNRTGTGWTSACSDSVFRAVGGVEYLKSRLVTSIG